MVNYPSTLRDEWASCFTATCLLPRRVRSLTVAPHVYSTVPAEVLLSCTDTQMYEFNFNLTNVPYIPRA